jgi:lysozyme family protein
MDMVDRVISREGGGKLIRDPHDPGMVTRFGISKRAYPDEDVENMTLARARLLYEQRLLRANLDKILDPYLRELVFDFHVHSDPWEGGGAQSIRVLQRLVGVKPDGVLGTESLQAINRLNHSADIYRAYSRERLIYLARLVQNRPTSVKYLTGWISRVLSI